MNNLDMLELIGNVRDSYIKEAQSHREPRKAVALKRRTPWKIILIAAAMALLLTGCTYVVLKLQDMKIGNYNPEPLFAGETFAPEDLNQDNMSVQGFAGSPGYLATKEWLEYQDSCTLEDPDFEAPEEYWPYICYSQEMVDKVDEICQKYGLKILGRMWTEQEEPKYIFEAVGIPGIQVPGTENIYYGGYYYQGGTFKIEGETKVEEQKFFYDFRCVMKDTLDYVTMSVGHIEDYDQWSHILPDGTEVLLAYSEDHALMIVDKPNYFVTLTTDPEEPTREKLEAFADTFTFDFNPQNVDAEKADAREEILRLEREDRAATAPDPLEDYESMFRKPSYAAFLEGYKDQKMYQNSEYILRDVTGDGREELIMQKDSAMRSQNDDGTERNDPCKITLVLTMGEDGLTKKLLHDEAALYEGDIFGGSIDWDGNASNYWNRVYFKLHNDGRHESVETIRYFSETKSWQRTNVPGASTEEDWELGISEEQAMAYVNAYKRADLDWKPITEFPMH